MHIHAKYNPDLTVSKEMETGYYNHKERNSIKTYIFEADSSSDPLDKTPVWSASWFQPYEIISRELLMSQLISDL